MDAARVEYVDANGRLHQFTAIYRVRAGAVNTWKHHVVYNPKGERVYVGRVIGRPDAVELYTAGPGFCHFESVEK